MGLLILHLLSEGCAERVQIRFQEPNVATHHAEMGNLLSLNPKIHRLRTDAMTRAAFVDTDQQIWKSSDQCPFTVREAARYLGVSPQTVYLWVERKQIPKRSRPIVQNSRIRLSLRHPVRCYLWPEACL